MNAPVLAAENIRVTLSGRDIVNGVTFSLARGEFTALVGPNGAGKTTLIRALLGLVPAQGKVDLAGRPSSDYSARERAKMMGYLPQGHVFHWPLPVETIVALGRYPYADVLSAASPADREAVARALADTGTTALAARPITALSGGERARVALARTLATQSAIVLADEPTVSLDARNQLAIMELLRGVARAGSTVLAVIHDLSLAARFADRVLAMREGAIAADGPPRNALTSERIAQVFGVEAAIVDFGEGPVPLPRRPI